MKIEHLRYFVHFANFPSINQAAKDLFISQPQLSRILTSLETELDTKLFVRSKEGTTLTRDGRYFLDQAVDLLCRYSDMQNFFLLKRDMNSRNNDSVSGHTILYVPPMFSIFLNDFCFKFREIVPGVNLTCVEDLGRVSVESIGKNGLHLVNYSIASEHPKELEDHVIEVIGSFKGYAIVNENSEYANDVEFDSSSCFEENPQSVTLTPEMYKASMPLGLPLKNVLFISSNIYQHIESIHKNNTISFLPDFALSKVREISQNVVMIPVKGNHDYKEKIIYSKSYEITPADKLVMAFLKIYMNNLGLINQHIHT